MNNRPFATWESRLIRQAKLSLTLDPHNVASRVVLQVLLGWNDLRLAHFLNPNPGKN